MPLPEPLASMLPEPPKAWWMGSCCLGMVSLELLHLQQHQALHGIQVSRFELLQPFVQLLTSGGLQPFFLLQGFQQLFWASFAGQALVSSKATGRSTRQLL